MTDSTSSIFNLGEGSDDPDGPPAPQAHHIPADTVRAATPPALPHGLPTVAPRTTPVPSPGHGRIGLAKPDSHYAPTSTHDPVAPHQPATGDGHSSDYPVAAPRAAAPGISEAHASDTQAARRLDIDGLLMLMHEANGSDLYLAAGTHPAIRVNGKVKFLRDHDVLTGDRIHDGLNGILTSNKQARFEETKELDFAHTVPGKARFRGSALRQRGQTGAVFRAIPQRIPTIEELGLPPQVAEFIKLPRGLILIVGQTGSGKTNTLAAQIDLANRTRHGHILTIEDPIEFTHDHQSCVITQREVGEDTGSYPAALKSALRESPDIIMIGELRDLDTISIALTAAETGHLVLATLHTQSAAETITRIVDAFPPDQQQQVRTQLAATLKGVVCQVLAPTADGKGRVAAVEIMVATSAIRAQIRENKLAQIPGTIQSGQTHGMITLDQSLARLVKEGRISYEVGASFANGLIEFQGFVGDKDALERSLRARASHQNGFHNLPTTSN